MQLRKFYKTLIKLNGDCSVIDCIKCPMFTCNNGTHRCTFYNIPAKTALQLAKEWLEKNPKEPETIPVNKTPGKFYTDIQTKTRVIYCIEPPSESDPTVSFYGIDLTPEKDEILGAINKVSPGWFHSASFEEVSITIAINTTAKQMY